MTGKSGWQNLFIFLAIFLVLGVILCRKVLAFTCGDSLTVTHATVDGVAPVDKTVTYGTVLTSLTGSTMCWISQNLGADRQASSISDDTEASAGWYWQFNRKQGYMCDLDRTPSSTWTSISENFDWQANNDPCSLELGAEWRIPTYAEWVNVINNGGE